MFVDFVSGGKGLNRNNFLYKLKSSKEEYSWWTCKGINCQAKLTMKSKDVIIEKGVHGHTNYIHEIKALQIFKEIKRRGVEETSTPIPTIYR